jgi:hypothetical protein
MKQQNEAALYAHLQYKVLHQLEITIPEYWFLDMVYQLCRDGWCYKSLESIAKDMRMTKNGVVKMRDRMIARGFITKDRKGRLKSSVTYNSVYRTDSATYNSVQNRTTQYTSAVPLSGTKNNNKNNKEKGIEISRAQNPTFTDSEHANARKASDLIRERFGSKLGLKRHA